MLDPQLLLILLYSALFAFTIKIADLLDEHGLKLFKGSKLLFGICWGILLALLVLSNPIVGSLWIAIFLYWVIYLKVDYPNHAIASVILLLILLWNASSLTFDWTFLLSTFFFYAGIKYLHHEKILPKHWFFNYNFHLLLLLIGFSIYNPLYLVALYSYLVDAAVYYSTKLIAARHGYT